MVLGLLIGAAALGGGFLATRNFVRRRLRFVDAVRSPAAPPRSSGSTGTTMRSWARTGTSKRSRFR